jgi:hypothetical protein
MKTRASERRNPRGLARAAALLLLLASRGAGGEPSGAITGTVDVPERLTGVAAIERQSGARRAGVIDRAAGRFGVTNLPLDLDYDLVLDAGAARLEGVNLRVPHSDYEEEQPLTADDIETIRSKVKTMNAFEDTIEFLAITGNVQHAALLLNKLRTQPFYNTKPGEIVWRLELWHYQKPDEIWLKDQDELFIIFYRERIPLEVYRKKSLTFDPALGGLRPTAGSPVVDVGRVLLPAAEPGIRMR